MKCGANYMMYTGVYYLHYHVVDVTLIVETNNLSPKEFFFVGTKDFGTYR